MIVVKHPRRKGVLAKVFEGLFLESGHIILLVMSRPRVHGLKGYVGLGHSWAPGSLGFLSPILTQSNSEQ